MNFSMINFPKCARGLARLEKRATRGQGRGSLPSASCICIGQSSASTTPAQIMKKKKGGSKQVMKKKKSLLNPREASLPLEGKQ